MRSWLLLTEVPLGVFFVGFNLLDIPPPLPLAPHISTSSVLIPVSNSTSSCAKSGEWVGETVW